MLAAHRDKQNPSQFDNVLALINQKKVAGIKAFNGVGSNQQSTRRECSSLRSPLFWPQKTVDPGEAGGEGKARGDRRGRRLNGRRERMRGEGRRANPPVESCCLTGATMQRKKRKKGFFVLLLEGAPTGAEAKTTHISRNDKGYRETVSQDAGYPGGWVKCPNLGAENV